MIDVTKLCITSTAEIALKRLKRAQIPVYNCKKEGANFIFAVKDKDVEKVFAIFAKPCYNVCVTGKSRRSSFLTKAANRIGLFVGAAIFTAAAILSNLFVLKISVSGSGSYLSPEITRIIYESGVKEFALYSGFDLPAATGKILALPQVTFCNIEKRGSVLLVDVQVDEEHLSSVAKTPLTSDAEGIVKNIVAICGTAAVQAGDRVGRGDELISAYTIVNEQKTDCIAVGYAELECKGYGEYVCEAESEENLKTAYSSVILQSEEILTRSHTVEQTDGGVRYLIEFTFLHKLSINME